MELHSRRTFLRRGTVGAAALGAAAALVPSLEGTSASAAIPAIANTGPFAAWVKDARTGEIAVMVGSQTLVHRDKKLAAQLARVAARATKS